MKLLVILLFVFAIFALLLRPNFSRAEETKAAMKNGTDENLLEATFAGGCFWCMQPPFDKLPGVRGTIVGYTGGRTENPTYEQVSHDNTGHAEAIRVLYDPKTVTYEKLLETFWHNIDPEQLNGQFHDRGTQYRTAIFFHSEEQKRLAEASKAALVSSGKFKGPIATTIEPASDFYRAEESHQDYYKKNSVHYNLYKVGSGRAAYIHSTWGDQ